MPSYLSPANSPDLPDHPREVLAGPGEAVGGVSCKLNALLAPALLTGKCDVLRMQETIHDPGVPPSIGAMG